MEIPLKCTHPDLVLVNLESISEQSRSTPQVKRTLAMTSTSPLCDGNRLGFPIHAVSH